jgi:hypothetical protein
MAIEIKEVTTKRMMREFIHLPAKIHRNHSNWVPPIYMDEWTYFNPKKTGLSIIAPQFCMSLKKMVKRWEELWELLATSTMKRMM